MNQTRDILLDGKISIVEMTQLQFMMVKLQMVSFDETIKSYTKVYESISTAFSNAPEESGAESEEDSDSTPISADDKMKILISLQQFASTCREELGLAEAGHTDTKVFETAMKALRQSQEAVETKKETILSGRVQKARASFSFGGKTYNAKTLPMAVFKHYFKQNPAATLEDALKAFPLDMKGNDVFMKSIDALELNKEYANPPYEESKRDHFKLADGTVIASYRLWSSGNIEEFVSHVVKHLKYDIKAVEKNIEILPRIEELYIPALRALKELGTAVRFEQMNAKVIEVAGITQEMLKVPQGAEGGPSEIEARLAWVRTNMKKIGLMTSPSRGMWEIADKNMNIDALTVEQLVQLVKGK